MPPSVKQALGNGRHYEVAESGVFKYNSTGLGESSSGRTADSGSVNEGSNPSSPASL